MSENTAAALKLQEAKFEILSRCAGLRARAEELLQEADALEAQVQAPVAAPAAASAASASAASAAAAPAAPSGLAPLLE